MINQKDINSIEHYISGIADADEIIFVESLFTGKQLNPEFYKRLEDEWQDELQQGNITNDELNQMLYRIHQIIRDKENRQRKSPLRLIIQLYSKVAAILLLPLIIAGALAYGYFGSSIGAPAESAVSSVIHAPLGARVCFNLPDGTIGWLNSGSSLTYSLPFNKNRIVSLDGEAWFDVSHNKKYPFEIKAGNSKIKVLGTSFNVSAYQGENYLEVVLQQGKIEFIQNNSSESTILAPSHKLVFKDGKTNVSIADPSKYKAWTNGKLVFRGDNMAEVARRIERWYNVKVILADKDLEKYSFRATFEDDSLEEVLRLLSLTSPIGYKITPRIINSDGTIDKVIVSLNKKVNIEIQ